MEEIKNAQFHSDINKMFESYLANEPKPRIMVRDLKRDMILTDDKIYGNVLFDSNLNMYKLQDDGTHKLVDNKDFDAVVVKE